MHDAIVAVYGIPVRDSLPSLPLALRQQSLRRCRPRLYRTDPVIIQIFTQRGRTDDEAGPLRRYPLAGVGVGRRDLFIGYVENGPQDWSFGFGRAQYLTGELAVPAAKPTVAAV